MMQLKEMTKNFDKFIDKQNNDDKDIKNNQDFEKWLKNEK